MDQTPIGRSENIASKCILQILLLRSTVKAFNKMKWQPVLMSFGDLALPLFTDYAISDNSKYASLAGWNSTHFLLQDWSQCV